jgi:hypothetical protein
VVEVPDGRLAVLAEIVKSSEKLNQLPPIKHALVEFVDIAGLVKGASQGEGLGNQFLANIRETAAICHVLRNFSDKNVLREGSVSPDEDLLTIRTELQLADLETLEKQRQPKGAVSKEDAARWETVQAFIAKLGQGQSILTPGKELTEQEKLTAKELCLLTAKDEIFVINVDEGDLKNAAEIKKEWASKIGAAEKQIVIISAKIESELAVLSAEDQVLYMEELGITESGLERLAGVAYETLNLQSFLTAGEIEVKAWTVHQGATAPEAAGVIHTDFEKNFIKAKVAKFTDLVEYGSWSALKDAGKLRQEGRDYLMQDGDVVEFMIGK